MRCYVRASMSLGLLLLVATQLEAQATRTWVSGVGDDANPCSRTAPCKTFAGAISKTAAGGEISVLDPGGFGAINITKSITIDGGGITASILASQTNGAIINAGPLDVVVLRNLSLNGANTTLGADTRGIKFLAGKKLIVENCTVSNFARRGISIESSTNNAEVVVSNTTVHGNTNNGILISPPAGVTVRVVLDHVRVLENTFFGIAVTAGANVQIWNSVISNNGNGLLVDGATAIANVASTLVSGSDLGIQSLNGGTVRMSNVTVTGNTTGLAHPSGTIATFGNNQVAGNAGGNGPAPVSIALQ